MYLKTAIKEVVVPSYVFISTTCSSVMVYLIIKFLTTAPEDYISMRAQPPSKVNK